MIEGGSKEPSRGTLCLDPQGAAGAKVGAYRGGRWNRKGFKVRCEKSDQEPLQDGSRKVESWGLALSG